MRLALVTTVTLGLALAIVAPGQGASAQQAACPQDPVLGRFLLPPEPCFDIEAWFDGPTTHYPHGVLGDDEEFTEIRIKRGRTTLTRKAVSTHVFEDLVPRLADVDGKPGPEVIVVETFERGGATLAIYKPDFQEGKRPKFDWIAGTQPIGERFRWLAPAAIADFDGDGQNDIAYVETPHLDAVLRFVTLRQGRLVELAAAEGFSNHRSGEAFISGGVRDCGAGPEVITANADWTRVMAAKLDGDTVTATDLGPFDGAGSFTKALDCAPL